MAYRFFATLAVAFAAFLLVGLVLPGRWSVEREIVMDAPAEEVFGYLDSVQGWEAWTPWPAGEPIGPDRGVGAGRQWDDPEIGDGVFRIEEADAPARLRYHVDVEGGALRTDGLVQLAPAGEGATQVRWREEGDFGWNPLMGWVARFMDRVQGRQLEMGLERLKAIVEGTAIPAAGGPARDTVPDGG